ncbi:MAG TPA: hypothetical protein VGQ91_01020 [Ideonella sp.]|nr:hypothetical protein [Ideonella sp.]
MSTSDRTLVAAKQLTAAGESIDQRDNRRWTALAHALERRDLNAARRLLKLGASPTAPIGPDDMPVAILAVIAEDLAQVKLMQQAGVDYTRLRYRGMTALDHARSTGNRRLLEALGGHSQSL